MLWVTSVSSRALAWPAIKTSYGPIGVPFDAHEIDKGVMLGSIEVLRTIQEQRSAEAAHEEPISLDSKRNRR